MIFVSCSSSVYSKPIYREIIVQKFGKSSSSWGYQVQLYDDGESVSELRTWFLVRSVICYANMEITWLIGQ